MKVLIDFRCPQGHLHEHFVDNETKHIQCQECPSLATKVISPIHFQLEGMSGDFPTAADKWVKNREEKMKYEKRQGHTGWGE